MAKNQSEKSPYLSSFGGGYIGAANYLTDLICVRIARKQGQDLPPFYWRTPRWKKEFKHQLLLATALLKLYDVLAIVRAIRKETWITSLAVRRLDDTIKVEQQKLDNRAKAQPQQENIVLPTESGVRPAFSHNPSLRKKLEELE